MPLSELSASLPEKTKNTPQSNTINEAIREDRIMKRAFLFPAVTVLLALSIFPLLWSLGISFTDIQRGGSTSAREAAQEQELESIDDLGPTGFLGLGFELTGRNYGRIFSDDRLHRTIFNTMFYVFAGVTIQYIIGFGLAMLLNQPFLGRNFVRVIFLMPMMMTPAAAAYTGRMMFDTTRSPTADFLREAPAALGLDPIIVPWLTDISWAPFTIVIIDSWQWIPFMMLILLAGLQAIPDDIYEAARVDGANAWTIFWRITFPIMLPVSLTVILIRGLEIFKIIDVIVVLTGGGPGSATESLTMYIYDTALLFGNYSYASAISYILLVLVVIFATLFLLAGRRISPPVNR